MTKEELQDIIKSHERWLNGGDGVRADLIGANLCDADLSGADLSSVNLRGADLRYADLSGTILRNADLRDADLSNANLSGDDLIGANLRNADLHDANLSDINLNGADLSGANLSYAVLCNADLCCADLRNTTLCYSDLSDVRLSFANLSNADLRDANLRNANLCRVKLSGANLSELVFNEGTAFYALQCPEEGSFIGYKKAHGYIVKLEILADAKRSSATSRKCRCSAAKVLSITAVDGSEEIKEIASDRDSKFIYRVGEIVRVDNFDEDRWNECSTGIHFFITRREAEQYGA